LPEIVSVNISNNSATVILSATGSFEYSLDNFTWQDSNIFTNLNIGEYIVYVRTKGGCIIGQKPFSIFNIPNAFTPNADGYNDQWKIAGLENYPGTEVNVYDRRGLPVFKEIISKNLCNGTETQRKSCPDRKLLVYDKSFRWQSIYRLASD
jgi:gliding motility-associated-like protein